MLLPANANWCTFAVWASKQAGVTIRDEDLDRAVRARLVRSSVLRGPILRVIELVGGTVEHHVQRLAKLIADFGPFRRSSDAVARGNKKVYEEIGREFARFLPLVAEGREESRAAIDGFCGELRPARRRTDRDSSATRFARTTGHASTPIRTRAHSSRCSRT